MAIDRDRLGRWVQPCHFQKRIIERYRRAFASHPARVLAIKGFLVADRADKVSRFLEREARFEVAYGLYSNANKYGNIPDVRRRDWAEAAEGERFFRFGELAGVRDEFSESPNFEAFQDFVIALKSEDFRIFFEAISGLKLGPAPLVNVYSYRAGDFLAAHTDDVKGKRLSFVFHFSRRWRREFGGILHMIDSNEEVTEIEPEYNELVIFDVAAKTSHFVSPVRADAGRKARLSVSGWFLTPAG